MVSPLAVFGRKLAKWHDREEKLFDALRQKYERKGGGKQEL